RPPNAFMLYRSTKVKEIVASQAAKATHHREKVQQQTVSVIIGQMWQGESADVKDHFSRLANQKKVEHKLENPDYHFRP
ncbi:hypothetical protein BDQ17DRAFT_1172410, partial [Cyathus striatus]